MVCLDHLGWPVELIKGRPIVNLIRLLLHTRKIVRKWEPPQQSSSDGQELGGNPTAPPPE